VSRFALPLVLVAALGGCALGEPVRPWEKRAHALPAMQIGSTVSDGDLERHVYANREAASGGDRTGGGGCGCR
jgi:hypothetical protein